MADVARLAGVSSQTVSRVSTGHPGVVDSTRQQVLAAMQQLGYRPNSAARALRLGEFRTIGVILFTLATTGNSRTVEAIASHAAQEGYAITLIPVAVPTQDGVLGAFTRLGELAVDGIIVIMEVHLLDAATVTLPPGMQVVIADSNAGDRYPVVDTDQADGARQAAQHLLDLGHETVWHVAGPEESFASERRAAAWRTALTAAGRPVLPIEHGDWSADSGYEIGLRMLAARDATAVFVSNDQMAIGLLHAAHELGIDVPGELSVVGFDDIPEARHVTPPLTSVRQEFGALGDAAITRIVALIEGRPAPAGEISDQTTLYVRKSTAPAPR